MNHVSYQIKLAQFEGPFDLLLFFIERDELDIYNIPINQITKDFLTYIHQQEKLNIELSSEFILFVSTLMRIKAKMLLPRKELDAQGNEIDPRQELVDKILEYKKYKEAAVELADMEALRMLMVKRGNLQKDLAQIGEESSEGTEIQNITLFKLMKAFERVMQRLHDKQNKPVISTKPNIPNNQDEPKLPTPPADNLTEKPNEVIFRVKKFTHSHQSIPPVRCLGITRQGMANPHNIVASR